MTIGDGRKIGIRFTQPLIGNVTGLNPPLSYKQQKIDLSGATLTTQNQYSSNSIKNAIDENETTYWCGTTAANWVKFALLEPKLITSIRLLLGGNYIKKFTFLGSNDGVEWTQIGEEFVTNATSTRTWYEFSVENETEYSYYKIDILDSSYRYPYIYEVELCETVGVGNEAKFKVSFDQYSFVPEGTLSKTEKDIESIEVVDENTIVLALFDGNMKSIQNSIGEVTVIYDGSGSLMGIGGAVEAFEVKFTPEELTYKGHQNDVEHIEIVGVQATSNLIEILYIDSRCVEHIEIADVIAVGSLISIDDI